MEGKIVKIGSEFKVFHAIAHPHRAKILSFVADNPRLHAGQISKRLGMKRSKVAYHLGLLEKYNVVMSEYKILKEAGSKGKAARVYSINEKEIDKILKSMEAFVEALK